MGDGFKITAGEYGSTNSVTQSYLRGFVYDIYYTLYTVYIVAKKWEPGNLIPSRFSGQIKKVEARLGKLAKIRKVEIN